MSQQGQALFTWNLQGQKLLTKFVTFGYYELAR